MKGKRIIITEEIAGIIHDLSCENYGYNKVGRVMSNVIGVLFFDEEYDEDYKTLVKIIIAKLLEVLKNGKRPEADNN